MATTRKMVMGLCMTFMVLVLFAVNAAAQMPTDTTERLKGEAQVATQVLQGEVVLVEGNSLVVKMSTGEVRVFNPPPERRFVVDGKELTVSELQVGTKLTATVKTTTTPITVRTTTVGTGIVRRVSGNDVTLEMPNGELRQYSVKPTTTFIIDGKPLGVSKLKKRMTISAEKIVEEPTAEFNTDTQVVGQAPPPPPPEPAPVVAATPAPEPTLPKTASPIPLMGLLGLLFVGGSFGIRMLRRS